MTHKKCNWHLEKEETVRKKENPLVESQTLKKGKQKQNISLKFLFVDFEEVSLALVLCSMDYQDR